MTTPSRLLVQLSEADLEKLVVRAAKRAIVRVLRAQQPPSESKSWLTVQEAADVLRCHPRQVRRLIADRQLAAAKANPKRNSRVLIQRTAVEALLANATH